MCGQQAAGETEAAAGQLPRAPGHAPWAHAASPGGNDPQAPARRGRLTRPAPPRQPDPARSRPPARPALLSPALPLLPARRCFTGAGGRQASCSLRPGGGRRRWARHGRVRALHQGNARRGAAPWGGVALRGRSCWTGGFCQTAPPCLAAPSCPVVPPCFASRAHFGWDALGQMLGPLSRDSCLK